MGKAVFILDRPDFQRLAEVLPKDAQRDKLEKRLRTARDEYQSHLHREGTIAAEVASVAREIARKPDPELTNRLGCLIAQREVWPALTRECAEAYVRALTAWASHTWHAFDAVYREEDAAASAEGGEFQRLARRENGMRRDDPQRDEIAAKIAELQARARPHITARDTAERGRAAVAAAVNTTLGGHYPGARVSERDITAYLDRHHTRKVAA